MLLCIPLNKGDTILAMFFWVLWGEEHVRGQLPRPG